MRIDGHYLGDLKNRVSQGDHELVIDLPKEYGGTNDSFSPTDLVAIGLATCVVAMITTTAKSFSTNVDGMSWFIDKEMTTDQPIRFASLKLTIQIPHDLSEKERKRIETAAHRCPVHNSLADDTDKEITFIYGE
ncbi:MAG: OsmC family protein [Lentisphaeria bacterium]|nr:OsmC family protein [Lentisphaeria bacterium]NQZ68291.1 OsmC family protein [Lentisphaeria bacterium]